MNEEFLKEKSHGKCQEYIDGDKLSIEFMKVDLASLKSTMEFIEAFKSSGRLLHTLICNAGMTSERRGILFHYRLPLLLFTLSV